MKQILTLALLVAAIFTACTKPETMRLVGTIAGAAGDKIVLYQTNINASLPLDSAVLDRDGSFELSAGQRLTEPTFFRAVLEGGKEIIFMADSVQCVRVTADKAAASWYESINFDGSVESSQLQQIIARSMSLQAELTAYDADYEALSADERIARGNAAVEKLRDYKVFVNQFVFENPRSMVSYYALFQTVNDMYIFDVLDRNDHILFATVATGLNMLYPEAERVKHLCDFVLQAKAIQKRQRYNDKLLSEASEIKSPDIKMPDKDGNEIVLSSLRGKVVILQFWLSDDKNCRNINRQLVKLYNKYNSRGLEIYQVSLDQSKVLWESALAADGLTWANVCDLQGAASVGAAIYNVREVPTNFIIDRDGTLIGKDLYSTRLDEKMQEIFH